MQPTFAFSLDTEFRWASSDRMPASRFEARYPDIRGTILTIFGELAPRRLPRGAHLLDHALAVPPRVHRPVERLPGLWDVKGSMLLHRIGVGGAIPMELRVRRARRGIRRAIHQEAVFHLWTHPMNLAHDREVMLTGLRAILREVADLRERGLTATSTMADTAELARAGTADAASGGWDPSTERLSLATVPGEGQPTMILVWSATG